MIPTPQQPPGAVAPPPAPLPPHMRRTPTGRRKPRTFHPVAFGIAVGAGAVALLGGWLARQVFYLRLESSRDLALQAGIVAGALLAAAGGFFAARVGKKLCALELLLAAVLLYVLTGGTLLAVSEVPGLLPGVQVGAQAGALFGGLAGAGVGLLFFSFIGSSVGFLLGGGGGLDLNFSYERFIARRHLLAKKRTTFISVISLISVLAVAVGVWALVVVLSVMSGFEEDLKGKILGTNAHAVVLKYASDFDEWDEISEEVRGVTGIVGVSPFILGEVMVSSRTQTAGALVKGILPERVGEVTELPGNVIEGDLSLLTHPERIDAWLAERRPDAAAGEEGAKGPKLSAVAIGQELARSLHASVGDRISVISPLSQEMGPTGPIPRSKSFRVGAVFYTGMYEYDSKFAYIHLTEAQKFFDKGDGVTGLELRTTDIDDTRAITRRVLTRIEGYPYYTKDWGEMNKNLFSALKLEKLVMAVILAFIVLVASFVILATLIMMVMEKGKEIAILKSMGVRDASIMKIFVLEGLAVGVVGTAVGLVLGLGTCGIIASGIIGLDPEVYYISTLPVKVEPVQIVLTSIIAVVLSYLATIYPSVTASRLHPVEGLRDE